jgi:DNA-directed RNA polymerase beta subunit
MSKIRDLHPNLFHCEEGLEITDKTYSFHSINPFVKHLSSPRSNMMTTHMSQMLPIKDGELKIIQTGIERQMVTSSFSVITQYDYTVISVIRNDVNESFEPDRPIMVSIIVSRMNEEYDTIEFDIIHLNSYEITSLGYGFTYDIDYEYISRLRTGSIIPKGTILARAPTHDKDDNWKFGVNANLVLLSLPEVAEDGIVMSKSLANRLRYDFFDVKKIDFGETIFPLNIYGDIDNYKIIPDIGETPKNHLVAALRKVGTMLNNPTLLDTDVSITSISDMLSYDNEHDTTYLVNVPTIDNDPNFRPHVVDVTVYKNNSTTYSNLLEGQCLNKYIDYKDRYYLGIMNTYQDHICKKYKKGTYILSPELKRVMVEGDAYLSKNLKNVFKHKNNDLDSYRIEVVTRVPAKCKVGSKCSDLFGSKGVVIDIREDDEMPYTIDKYGNKIVADIIMDPASVVSRMNPGRCYEHFFNHASRNTQAMLRSMVKNIRKPTDKEVIECFNILLEFYSIFQTAQYNNYLKITDIKDKRDVVITALNEEVYIHYKVDSDKRAIEIVMDLTNSKFNPEITDIYMKNKKTGKDDKFIYNARIAPIYEILLNRRSDNFLATSIAKVNHFGLPISTSGSTRNKSLGKSNPVRLLSETDTRLIIAYGSQELLMELRDRGVSHITVKEIYKNILTSEVPTNVENLVDRDKVPYGEDSGASTLKNVLSALGMKLTHIDG